MCQSLPKILQGYILLYKLLKKLKSETCQATSITLVTLPDLVPQLGSLYQLMETRVKTLNKMSRLNGKLYLLITQVATSEISQRIQANQEAQVVYEEESSDEESGEEQNTDSDDNWEEEEDEDDGESETSGDSEEDMNVDKVNGDSDGDPGNESEEE